MMGRRKLGSTKIRQRTETQDGWGPVVKRTKVLIVVSLR